MQVVLYIIIGVLSVIVIAGALRSRYSTDKASSRSDLSLIQTQLNDLTDRIDERMARSSQAMTEVSNQQYQNSSRLIQEITHQLTKLDETNNRVIGVTAELKTLQNVLKNPKQRGVLGEYYLETVLKNVLPPGQFKLQYKMNDGSQVDAVIFIDNKIVPVDSKFSLENYNRLIEEDDQAKRKDLVKLFKSDLKNRIDETAKYIKPEEDTMDFAFMFIPSEAIYYDLLVNRIGTIKSSSYDLIEYAFREKKVIIVSPTSFLAYLQTVLQGLRSLQIEKQTQKILKNVTRLGEHLNKYQNYHDKVGNSLATVVNHYNNSHKQFKLIDQDVVRLIGGEKIVTAIEIDKPQKE